MPRMNFTDMALRSLKPPDGKQINYWDQTLPSFGLRASPGGTRTFFVMYGQNRRRTTIGRYPTITLSEARKEAKRILAEITLGKHRSITISFEDAQKRFLEDCKAKNRPRTVSDYERLLARHFRLGKVHLEDITQHEVMRRINKLSSTPSEARHAFVALRTFLNWAVRNGYLNRNPIQGVSPPATNGSRERVLSDFELGTLYSHARAYPYPYGHIVALLALTGQRRGEIGALEWEWINQADRTITLPKTLTKNERTHVFPYGELTAAILSEIPEGQYLFPASRAYVRGKPTTIFNGWAKGKPEFDMGLQIAPYTLHDLRRTFSSNLAAFGTPIHVTEKLLNHVSGSLSGVAAIYNRHTYMKEMCEAIANLDAHIASLIKS